jgi:predicted transcriptional regulator
LSYYPSNILLISCSYTRKKRGKQELYASLLAGVAAEHRGMLITKLMYASLLSHRQLTRHLQILLKDRLLEYNEQEKVYKIRTKGLQFIQLYTKMAEMLEPFS